MILCRKALHKLPKITKYSTALLWRRVVICPIVAPGSLISVSVSSVSLLDVSEGSLRTKWSGILFTGNAFPQREVKVGSFIVVLPCLKKGLQSSLLCQHGM